MIRSEPLQRLFRFIISGGTAAFVNIAVLYLLTRYAGVWYLASSVVAVLTAMLVGFLLQKFWTFNSRTHQHTAHELLHYVGINVFNLALNTVLLYVFVEWVGLWYVVAQIVTSVLLAFESFFVYRIIFSHTPLQDAVE